MPKMYIFFSNCLDHIEGSDMGVFGLCCDDIVIKYGLKGLPVVPSYINFYLVPSSLVLVFFIRADV